MRSFCGLGNEDPIKARYKNIFNQRAVLAREPV
jgi:hypothetical protein